MTSSTELQQSEIRRLLKFAGSSSPNPFAVLGIDMEHHYDTVDFSSVSKNYKKIALLLHPDKCDLPHASDAFQVAERAYTMVNDEIVFERLRETFRKKADKEKETHTHIGPAGGWKNSSNAPSLPPIAFGELCQLAPQGSSSEEQVKKEIARIMKCKPNDYFIILDLNPSDEVGCTVENVTKRYRHMAKSLHPDKCSLEGVKDVFVAVEKAYRELSDERKLVRYKAGFIQQRKREAAELSRKAAATGGSGSGVALTEEERKAQALQNAIREQQLRAVRLAEEEDRKRERDHQKKVEEDALNQELKRQKEEWSSMKLF